jgi:hypothetical protein
MTNNGHCTKMVFNKKNKMKKNKDKSIFEIKINIKYYKPMKKTNIFRKVEKFYDRKIRSQYLNLVLQILYIIILIVNLVGLKNTYGLTSLDFINSVFLFIFKINPIISIFIKLFVKIFLNI